jgi:hypothetical protein
MPRKKITTRFDPDRRLAGVVAQHGINVDAIKWYCDSWSGRVVRDEPYLPTSLYACDRRVLGMQIGWPSATSLVTIDHSQLGPITDAARQPSYDYQILTLTEHRPDWPHDEALDKLHPQLTEHVKHILASRTDDYGLRNVAPPDSNEEPCGGRLSEIFAEPWCREYDSSRRFVRHRLTLGRCYREYRRRDQYHPPHPIFELFESLIEFAMSYENGSTHP